VSISIYQIFPLPNITLPEKKGHLAATNFIIRLSSDVTYKDTYWLHYRHSHNFFSRFQCSWCFQCGFSMFVCYSAAFCQLCFYNKDWIRLDWNS